MKNFIIRLATIAAITACLLASKAQAQTKVIKDAQGNYHVAKRDTSAAKATGKPTGHTITDYDGKVHPLLLSPKGKPYYMRTSKNGKLYKCYVKIDVN